jgi:hypothetical protein
MKSKRKRVAIRETKFNTLKYHLKKVNQNRLANSSQYCQTHQKMQSPSEHFQETANQANYKAGISSYSTKGDI